MKAFNLEEAKAGKPVCTKEGNDVKIICWDLKQGTPYKLIGLVSNNGFEEIAEYTESGRHILGIDSNEDLCMKTVKKEGWINIFRDVTAKMHCYASDIHETEEIAIEQGSKYNHYIATIKIKWNE